VTAQKLDANLALKYIKMLIVMEMEYWIMFASQPSIAINGLSFLQRDVLAIGVYTTVLLLNVQMHLVATNVLADQAVRQTNPVRVRAKTVVSAKTLILCGQYANALEDTLVNSVQTDIQLDIGAINTNPKQSLFNCLLHLLTQQLLQKHLDNYKLANGSQYQ